MLSSGKNYMDIELYVLMTENSASLNTYPSNPIKGDTDMGFHAHNEDILEWETQTL